MRLLDTRTGRWRSIKRIGPGLLGEKLTYHNWLVPLAVSPDHKWILCFYDAVPGSGTYQAISITSRKRLIWPADDVYQTTDLHWLPDSQHWFYPSGGRLWVYSLVGLKPRTVQLASHTDLGCLGVTPKGKVIVVIGGLHTVGGRFTLYAFDAKRGAAAQRLGSMQFPDNLVLSQLVLSPKGDRMAWTLEANDTSSQPMVSLWTSSLDGTHRRLIGETHEDNWLDMTYLQWTPDGKRLSFNYGNRLWTVPAP